MCFLSQSYGAAIDRLLGDLLCVSRNNENCFTGCGPVSAQSCVAVGCQVSADKTAGQLLRCKLICVKGQKNHSDVQNEHISDSLATIVSVATLSADSPEPPFCVTTVKKRLYQSQNLVWKVKKQFLNFDVNSVTLKVRLSSDHAVVTRYNSYENCTKPI